MKAIHLIFTILFLSAGVSTQAQDILTFKSGDEVKAKVVEVGLTEIKYKKADNPDGPLYTTLKSSVFMIKYENGTRDVFNAPQIGDPQAAKTDDKTSSDYRHLYRKNLAGGIVMTCLGAPLAGSGLILSAVGISYLSNPGYTTYDSYNYGHYSYTDGTPFLVSGLLMMGAGVPLTVVGGVKIKRAKRYKAKARSMEPTMSFNPIVSPAGVEQASNFRAGVGLRLNF